jgi:hypothetical protein
MGSACQRCTWEGRGWRGMCESHSCVQTTTGWRAAATAGADASGAFNSIRECLEGDPLLGVVVRNNDALLGVEAGGRNKLVSRIVAVVKVRPGCPAVCLGLSLLGVVEWGVCGGMVSGAAAALARSFQCVAQSLGWLCTARLRRRLQGLKACV